MEEAPVSVYAVYNNFNSPSSPFMDFGKLVFEMKNGTASCDMYFCNDFAYPRWELEITGTKGVIAVRQSADTQEDTAALYNKTGIKILPIPKRVPDWETFWVKDLKNKRTPAVTARDALEITRLSLLARKSARTNSIVKV
jgi:predicted dehydrogenase